MSVRIPLSRDRGDSHRGLYASAADQAAAPGRAHRHERRRHTRLGQGDPVTGCPDRRDRQSVLHDESDRLARPELVPRRHRRPGPDYWQQRADYTITATLDTATRRMAGTVTVHYANNSPDTLRFVWMQLDQNLFRPGAKAPASTRPTRAIAPAGSRVATR